MLRRPRPRPRGLATPRSSAAKLAPPSATNQCKNLTERFFFLRLQFAKIGQTYNSNDIVPNVPALKKLPLP